ncbi:MAG TPA: RNA polymerase sigma factor [Candidatus Anaerofilum faecale]|nr:RNA polymerase sigma factor [Candidatus Anaerofilum faecale]
MSDEELVLCAQGGNADALDELIRRWYPGIHAFCCRRVQSDTLGADLTQDTFLKLVAALPRYRAKGSFKSWLFTIAANACTDAVRRSRPTADLDELAEVLPDARAAGFAGQVEAGEAVRRALADLPDVQREALILRYYHDFEIEEIARITHTLAPTVKTRLWRGLRRMKLLLGEEWKE